MTTRKLTKTEKAILDRMRVNGTTGVDWGSGRGAEGGRHSWGARETAAARSLAKRGLVNITSDGETILYKRGYGMHVYLWRLALAPHLTVADVDRLLAV